MPKLTQVKETKRGRYALFFDGEFAFSLDEDTFAMAGLHTGDELEEWQIHDLQTKSDTRKAVHKAIDLLDEACACCNLAHPVISEYLGMQKELDALKQEEAEMENADVNEPIDYERVAERKTRIAKLEAELPAKQAAASEIQVTMDDVAKVIELWTGIPAVKIRETEYAKLASLESELKKKIIGQDEAVAAVEQGTIPNCIFPEELGMVKKFVGQTGGGC